MKKLYLFVLDFSTGRVHRYRVDDLEFTGFNDEPMLNFMIEKGHSPSNCEWMTTDNPELEY
jgi:hypothetical protein